MQNKTIADLEALSNAAVRARNNAQWRLNRIDQILAAMTLIDDVAADVVPLGREVIVAVNKADNAQAFAELTAIRAALDTEIDGLIEAAEAAESALNDAPDEAA